jgi:hypothetical protein
VTLCPSWDAWTCVDLQQPREQLLGYTPILASHPHRSTLLTLFVNQEDAAIYVSDSVAGGVQRTRCPQRM